MNNHFVVMPQSGELNHGIVSDLLIQQMIVLQMEEEKRLNHNRFEMERNSFKPKRQNKGEKKSRNVLQKPAKGNPGRFQLVLRAIGIKV